jgi:hypothetical protein
VRVPCSCCERFITRPAHAARGGTRTLSAPTCSTAWPINSSRCGVPAAAGLPLLLVMASPLAWQGDGPPQPLSASSSTRYGDQFDTSHSLASLTFIAAQLSTLLYSIAVAVLKKRSTAAAQLPLISAGLDSIIKSGVIVAGISSDNEMVNYTLFQLVSRPFPFLVHVPCAAHTIQLLVKSALSLPAVADALEGMDAMLHSLEGSKQLRNTLEQLQATLRPNRTALKHQLFNATRWSSRLRSIQRLLELKQCLSAMTDKIMDHLKQSKKIVWHQFKFEETWWQTL